MEVVLQRTLAAAPDQRFGSAAELAEALRPLASESALREFARDVQPQPCQPLDGVPAAETIGADGAGETMDTLDQPYTKGMSVLRLEGAEHVRFLQLGQVPVVQYFRADKMSCYWKNCLEPLPVNQPIHLAVVFGGGKFDYYINGEPQDKAYLGATYDDEGIRKYIGKRERIWSSPATARPPCTNPSRAMPRRTSTNVPWTITSE